MAKKDEKFRPSTAKPPQLPTTHTPSQNKLPPSKPRPFPGFEGKMKIPNTK